ncbi:hypothetical protein BDP27DRAFT_1356614 [Rhodocollybia butyracea]|uniref:Uncharacterized protein n=1 Tax=Rhodocollybia butyracea TaxID=206335 RepID=A0A9P5UGV1_9AGAR|nr:hypothetical protein BDP27DRAFT_1356614 [Rhodocollybia butyracea]
MFDLLPRTDPDRLTDSGYDELKKSHTMTCTAPWQRDSEWDLGPTRLVRIENSIASESEFSLDNFLQGSGREGEAIITVKIYLKKVAIIILVYIQVEQLAKGNAEKHCQCQRRRNRTSFPLAANKDAVHMSAEICICPHIKLLPKEEPPKRNFHRVPGLWANWSLNTTQNQHPDYYCNSNLWI